MTTTLIYLARDTHAVDESLASVGVFEDRPVFAFCWWDSRKHEVGRFQAEAIPGLPMGVCREGCIINRQGMYQC